MENLYELMLINKPELAEKEEKKIFAKIEEIIKDKGKIIKTANIGKRALAYNIKKEKEGNYWLLNLEVEPAEIAEFSSKLKVEEDILRFLILRKDDVKVKKSEAEKKPEQVKEDNPAVAKAMARQGKGKKSK